MSATALFAVTMRWQDFWDNLLRAQRHSIPLWKKTSRNNKRPSSSVSNIWLGLDTKSREVEIDCLPGTSTEASPKHTEKELERPRLELVRNTKGNVNEGFQLAGQQQNKDRDNMGPPLNRVSYAVTKGIEKLNVLDTFSAWRLEAFSNKILPASQVFMPSSKVQRTEVLSRKI